MSIIASLEASAERLQLNPHSDGIWNSSCEIPRSRSTFAKEVFPFSRLSDRHTLAGFTEHCRLENPTVSLMTEVSPPASGLFIHRKGAEPVRNAGPAVVTYIRLFPSGLTRGTILSWLLETSRSDLGRSMPCL